MSYLLKFVSVLCKRQGRDRSGNQSSCSLVLACESSRQHWQETNRGTIDEKIVVVRRRWTKCLQFKYGIEAEKDGDRVEREKSSIDAITQAETPTRARMDLPGVQENGDLIWPYVQSPFQVINLSFYQPCKACFSTITNPRLQSVRHGHFAQGPHIDGRLWP